MKPPRFNSLEARLTQVLMALTLIPIFLIGWIAFDQEASHIKADRMKTVGRVADARHEQLTMVLQRAIGRSRAFLADMDNRCGKAAASNDCGVRGLRAFLASEAALGATLKDGAGGHLALGDPATTAGETPRFRPGQLAQFTTRIPGDARKFFIVVSDPGTGMELALTYSVTLIQPIFAAHPDLGNSGENFLADGEGFFITSARYPAVQGHGHPISARPMHRCLGLESAETLDLDYRDMPIIHGFRFIPEIGGGCIMAHVDQAEAFAPLRALRIRFFLLMLLISGAIVFIVRRFARKIAAPLKQLTRVTGSIAAGNLAARASADGYAEIDELALAFNTMAEELVRINTGLEQQVAQRTALLRESEARHRGIFENANTGIASTDDSGRVTDFNEAFRAMLGYDADTLRQMNFADFTHPDDLAVEAPLFDEVLAGQRDNYHLRKRYIASNGGILWVDISVAAIRDDAGNMKSFVGVISDITEHQNAEENLNLMAKVFKNSGEGIVITDTENRIFMVNEAFTRLTGYGIDDVRGQNPKVLSAGRTPNEVYREMWQALADHGSWEGELWDRRKTGETYPKWLSIVTVADATGKVGNYIGSFTDISERKASEERIHHLAYHDPLTGLPNRFSLNERLTQALGFARRNGKRLALMLIDLDNFKTINDTLGHPAGDQLLVQVARRLIGAVRDSDVVARLGGDEFVVVLSDIDNPADAAHVADKVTRSIGKPYFIDGQDLHTSPSIGICLFPDDATETQDLVKKADVAMYHAKSHGRGSYQFFAEEMQQVALWRVGIEADLRNALLQGQLVLHYQPQVDLRNGQISGVEALVRWRHPSRGLLAPAEFIPIAEESGLIAQLGDWVLREACRQLAAWRAGGITHIRMAVNLSPDQFSDLELPARIQEILADAGLPADSLDIEVTESTTMTSPTDAVSMMKVLTGQGLTLSIDDFGTGYSSLAYLKLFPIGTLKIDRSFVKDIENDPNDADICDVTVLLAHKLGLEVVAEGVETEAQLKYLLSIGCEKIQGYLVSKPLPAAEVEAFIRNHPPMTGLGTVELWTGA